MVPRRAAYSAQFLAAIVLLAVVAPACGGGSGGGSPESSVDEVLAEIEGLEGAAREKKLLDLAEAANGELSLYTTAQIDLAGALADAFEDEYDLDTSVFKGADALVPRILEERKAGFHGADVVEAGGIDMNTLSEEGALQPYRSPAAANLVEGSAHEDWTADRLNVFAVSRNTDLVPEDEAPTAWEDLADPKWKGKLALYDDDADWLKTLWEYWVDSGKSPADADRLIEGIGRNATFIGGRSLLRELMAAGEFELGVDLRHNVQRKADDGAPLAWQPPVEPFFWRPDGVAMIAEPPNPAAAVLFIDWLLGDGQKVFEEFKTDPQRKDLLVAPSVQQLPVNIEDFYANQDEWQKRWQQFVRLGSPGPEG
jgi:iron(III) transport system substrate-binding protein